MQLGEFFGVLLAASNVSVPDTAWDPRLESFVGGIRPTVL